MDGYLNKAEAAARIGISVRTLEKLMGKRQIAFFRIGSRVRFLEKDVSAYLDSCRVPAVSCASPEKKKPGNAAPVRSVYVPGMKVV